jgi:aspartate-semialdehyde dehydrogenase
MDERMQVAVVGATGIVGKEILAVLAEDGFPAERLTVLASERSEGTELEYGDETLGVEKATPESFRGMNVVFFAAPADVARTLAPAAQAAGAWVVDSSSHFRGEAHVPLVGPVARSAVPQQGRIVSVASPVTAVLSLLTDGLRGFGGVSEISATSLHGASTRGMAGVRELERQTADLLSGREPEIQAFAHRLGFNLIPEVGTVAHSGWTDVEQEPVTELTRLLGASSGEVPVIALTALYVPTFYGICLSGTLRLKSGATLEAVRKALGAQEGLKVLDAPGEHVYPLAQLVVGDPAVHVGRLRLSPSSPGLLSFVAAIDNAGWAARMAVRAATGLKS